MPQHKMALPDFVCAQLIVLLMQPGLCSVLYVWHKEKNKSLIQSLCCENEPKAPLTWTQASARTTNPQIWPFIHTQLESWVKSENENVVELRQLLF